MRIVFLGFSKIVLRVEWVMGRVGEGVIINNY